MPRGVHGHNNATPDPMRFDNETRPTVQAIRNNIEQKVWRLSLFSNRSVSDPFHRTAVAVNRTIYEGNIWQGSGRRDEDCNIE
jgi:hypothetical protein